MDAPDTVTEAVQLLESSGFKDQLRIDGSELRCGECGRAHDPSTVEVSHVFRFEGDSDPGDEAIVVGLVCPACGATGVIASAYGPDADPQVFEVLSTLAN
ncbi:MAG TPA: hypothetical protein VJM33_13625 [Microthrixaceae bacterium]|nr:hypothetical protein [Microthrixaceae bacterium]